MTDSVQDVRSPRTAHVPANTNSDLLANGVPTPATYRAIADHAGGSTDDNVLPAEAEIALTWMDLVF